MKLRTKIVTRRSSRRVLKTAVSAILVVTISASDFESAQEPEVGDTPAGAFGRSMFSERSDLRSDFFSSIASLRRVETSGSFLLIGDGILRNAKTISTNACPTVGSALSRYVPDGVAARRQIRLIQKNAAFQTPKPRSSDPASREKLFAMAVAPGDVVIVTRVEF
jgi:hypothetical protein